MKKKSFCKIIKKIISLTLVCCLCSTLLTGCGVSAETVVSTINTIYRKVGKVIYDDDHYSNNEGNYIDARIEAIINAANNDDADTICTLFGSNIADSDENLYDEACVFAGAIDGELISHKELYETESASSRDHDGIKIQIHIVEEITTTEGKYVISFYDNPEVYDDDLKGLQSLGAWTYEDYENNSSDSYVCIPDKREEELQEQIASACEKFNLTEEDYQNLTTTQQENLLRIGDIFSDMESKYDQKFCSVQELNIDMLDEKVDQLMLYPKNGDPETECFTAYWNEENNRFFDNYQDIIIQKQIGEMIVSDLVFDGINTEVKVIADIQDTNFFSDKADITWDDIKGNVTADCTVFIKEPGGSAETDQISEGVQNWFSLEQVYGNHRLVIVNEEKFDAITMQNYMDISESSILYQEEFRVSKV